MATRTVEEQRPERLDRMLDSLFRAETVYGPPREHVEARASVQGSLIGFCGVLNCVLVRFMTLYWCVLFEFFLTVWWCNDCFYGAPRGARGSHFAGHPGLLRCPSRSRSCVVIIFKCLDVFILIIVE